MLIRAAILFILTALLGCGHSRLYNKQISVLDSTKIVLRVKLNELKKAETNIQLRGYSKYDLYKQFLNSNLKDTISHSEATTLQQFLSSGEVIKHYNETKS